MKSDKKVSTLTYLDIGLEFRQASHRGNEQSLPACMVFSRVPIAVFARLGMHAHVRAPEAC